MSQPAGGEPQPAYTPPPGHVSVDPSTLSPPAPPSELPRRGLSLRWLIAGLATLAVVAAIVGVLALAPPESAGGLARIAPAGSPLYIELRMDLPGDQRERLAAFLQHFPGFADQATMETKILDTFDQLLLTATSGSYSWRDDVEPWFGGQLALFASGQGDARDSSGLVIALSVKDRSWAESFLQQVTGPVGLSVSYYRDVAVYSLPFGGGVVAVTQDALLLGISPQAVTATIDVGAGEAPALLDDERFERAAANVRADRLGLAYIDFEGLRPLVRELGGGLGMLMPAPGISDQLDALSGSLAFELRVENDHLALTARGQPEPGASLPPEAANRGAGLAEMFPRDTLLYVEGRDLGAQLKDQLGRLGELLGAEAEAELADIEAFLGTPLEDYLDFVADGAFSVTVAGERYSGGLVARVSDEGVALHRLERLSGALRTAAALGALPLTVEDAVHGDARITVFRLREGPGGEVPGLPIGQLPFSSVSYIVARGLLLLGTEDFVTETLSREPAASLAGEPGYRAALEAAGGLENRGIFYLDLRAGREQLETMISERDRARYDTELLPYLQPFDRLVGVTVVEGDEQVTRLLLLVE